MTEQAAEITWTQHDLDCAQAVITLSSPESDNLPTLTDEEIVALDGLEREQFVELPWLAEHQDQKELVCNVALRTLLTKGFAFPLVSEGETLPSALGATDNIVGVMTLRRTGERIISAELTKSDDKAWLYGYLHQDQVLEELVDSAGTHTFTVVPAAEFGDHLLQLADAADLESEDGEPQTYSEAEFEAAAPTVLADARGVTVIAGISAAEDSFRHYTIYTTSTELFGLTSAEKDGAAELSLAKVSRSTAVEAANRVIFPTS
ncbi:hypothetical protein [Psychromicrobium lacuslunae]|uniref:hypothetical protein n=1 Tax=Psychromicrobium lacuslunae TaxID=1618207 RepID=UPI000696CCB6|nr:hypothetical protein [Psychromicrobium lacuslunae]